MLKKNWSFIQEAANISTKIFIHLLVVVNTKSNIGNNSLAPSFDTFPSFPWQIFRAVESEKKISTMRKWAKRNFSSFIFIPPTQWQIIPSRTYQDAFSFRGSGKNYFNSLINRLSVNRCFKSLNISETFVNRTVVLSYVSISDVNWLWKWWIIINVSVKKDK